MKIQRADQSFLFLGDGDESLDISPGSLLVLNRDDRKILDAFESAGAPISDSDIAGFCSQSSLYRPGMDVTKAELGRTNWRRQEKMENVGEWKARVPEWEIGLPSGGDLTPLSQSLIPSILALAFSIIAERSRTIHDVNRASRNTLSSLRSSNGSYGANASSVVEEVDRVGSTSPRSDPKKQKKSDGGEVAVDSMAEEGDSGTEDEDASGKGKF